MIRALGLASAPRTPAQPRSMPAREFAAKTPTGFDSALPSGIETHEFTAVRSGNAIEVNAKASVATSFIQPFGHSRINIAAESHSQRGSKKAEVVLALDNTGSMATNNKMPELKRAAKRLVDILEGSVTEPGQMQVGLVPFATSVRVNPASGPAIEAPHGSIPRAATDRRRSALRAPDPRVGCSDRSASTTPTRQINLARVHRSRASPYNTSDAGVVSGTLTALDPAIQNCRQDENRMVFVQPLTTAFSSLRTSIDNMTPGGNTNVTIGVAWGLTLLSRQDPFRKACPIRTRARSELSDSDAGFTAGLKRASPLSRSGGGGDGAGV